MPEDLPRALCRPEGTMAFQYRAARLFDPAAGRGNIIHVVAGRHIFRLERDEHLTLSFTHSSPGAGTRVAALDMSQLAGAPGIHVFLLWSPDSAKLVVGPLERNGPLLEADGTPASTQLVVGRSGEVFAVGDSGAQVAGFRAYEGNELVAEPPAIATSRDTVRAVRMMRGAHSGEGFMFEVVQANAIVSMLVTGFEAYAQKRFQELAGEGIPPNLAALRRAFPRISVETPATSPPPPGDEAPLLAYTARTGINFQNYEDCKRAYREGYGLRFSDIADLSSVDIRDLKLGIALRHRAIHVSPLQTIRNMTALGTERPECVNLDYADGVTSLFEKIIEGLHQATLGLRPPDSA